jgi:teichuronic acid biosynthesis glycosyltransferase TuaH
MIKDRDIIVYGLQPWDLGIASTCKYTALEMSKHNRVLYVSPPLQRKFAMFHKELPEVQKRIRVIKGEEPDLEQINENMWTLFPNTIVESINWIKSAAAFNFFNKFNDKRFARQIKKTADKLGFSNYILFNDNSMINGFYLKEYLKPDIFIYLLRDAVILVPYHKLHGSRLQPQIIAKADIAVTNSDFFADYARNTNPNSHMIGQGCDLTRYNDTDGKLKIPDDLKDIKKPVIGYVGFLTEIRLDIEVLVHIAEQKPEWSLVLVGPEDDAFKNSKLHELSNVIFLGRKRPDELAEYIKGFDVALNPQIVNPITDINYPLKIDEYLAMGKPTVATKTTFMEYFRDHTYLPSTKEEYVTEIEKALKEDSPQLAEERIAVASSHSWENFVAKIYGHIEDLQKKRKQN